MEQQWDSQQQQFIEKLERMDQTFNLIFEKDSGNQVIGVDEQMDLKKLQAKNKKILEKLKGGEFSVAIVGLEKAGKSTLGNAIIRQNALPEYTERCTYATTEVRAGQTAEAEITFFSRDEFNKKFHTMMRLIQYKQPFNDFAELSLSGFEAWWESMGNCEEGTPEKMAYNAYNATIMEDVKIILQERAAVEKYLGHAPEKLPTSGTEFKVFITGFASHENGRMANRTAIPYTVKNVIIRSTTLEENLRNVVLYDVPGFDSPTDLHKEQTEEMLKIADAIILVTNAGSNPNLTGTQLDMLRKVRDEDGVALNEKAFVFGNRLDMARSNEAAMDNVAALKRDVEKNGIAKSGRVLYGSAKAYLEANNIEDSDSRGKTNANKVLDEWNIPYGRDELYGKLSEYYRRDRFDVLQKRAEKTLHRAEDYLNEILERYTPDVLDRIDNGEQYVIEIKNAMHKFSRRAWNIVREHQDKVRQESPFSTRIQENIDEIFPLVDENNDLLIQTMEETSVGGGDGLTLSVTEIDANFRKKLRNLLLNNLKDMVAELTGTKQGDIREEIVQAFLDAIGCEPAYREELSESVRKLFKELHGKKTSGNTVGGLEECSFNSLIDRFAGSPIAALILHPFGSNERKKEVLEMAKFEFLSLAVYYDSTSGNKLRPEQEKQDIVFTKILAHNDSGGNPVKRNEQGIRDFFNRNKNTIFQGLSLAADILPMGKWAKMLLKAGSLCIGGKEAAWMDAVKTAMNQPKIRNACPSMSAKDKQELVTRLVDGEIDRFCRDKINTALDDSNENGFFLSTVEDRLQELSELNIPRIGTMEELLAVLNLDITILRDIMRRAVIAAIGLERAFNNLIGKNADFIRAVAEDSTFTQIDEWTKQNARKVRNSSFASLEQEKMKRETKKNIVAALRAVLDKMDDPAPAPTEG